MVVPRVERTQLLPCEVWDLLGIATGDVLVRQTREQRPAEGPVHRGARRCQRALHLVEHHALVAEAALRVRRILELKTDAFLLERVLREAREECRVEVDVEKVLEVFGVPGAEQIHRPVGAGQRVHECRK